MPSKNVYSQTGSCIVETGHITGSGATTSKIRHHVIIILK